MRWGIDYLLGACYPDVIYKTHPKGWAAGFFAGWYRKRDGKVESLEKALPVVKKMIEKGLCSHFRIQLFWDDGHNFKDSDMQIVIPIAREYDALAATNPKIKIELSPFTEHNLASPDKYLNALALEAPHCTIVNNPYKGGRSKKYKNEVHGKDKKPSGKYNFSFDGYTAVDANVTKLKKRHSKSDVFFLWMWQLNRRLDEHDTTPRANRTVVPSKEQLESLAFLANTRGKVKLPAKYIWKSHAEQESKTTPKGREQKPVFLSKKKYNKVELILGKRKKNKVIATLPYSSTSDGRFLYRLAGWGYQLTQEILANQKMPVVRVKVDGKVIGKVNPAFRSGEYR